MQEAFLLEALTIAKQHSVGENSQETSTFDETKPNLW
jgi:hypothetical protein